jgi:hypothetical protein
MTRALLVILTCFGLIAVSTIARADDAKAGCAFSDVAKLKEHLAKHVSYPAKGKAIKSACKKEMPDEFSQAERACAAKKLKDGTEYKSADEVIKALGVE